MKTLNTRWKLIALVPLVVIAILSMGNKTLTPGDWVLRKGDRIVLTVPEFRGGETGYLVFRGFPNDMAMLSFGPSGELRTLAFAPFGTALPGGWRTDWNDQYYAGDFNGDGRGDVLVESPWGIGILIQGGPLGLKTLALYPYGTVLDGHLLGSKATWRLGPTRSRGPVIADINHDGRADVLIVSEWGLGILGGVYNGFGVLNAYPFGTKLVGGWTLGSGDIIAGTGDFNGDGQTDILIRSDWGVGFLTRDAATGELITLAAVPYGDTGMEWTLSKYDSFWRNGDFDKDGRDELLFRRNDGSIALLSLKGSSLNTLVVAHPGDRLGDWLLGKEDSFGWIADYNGDGKAELFVRSGWGMGILRFQPSVIPSGPDRPFVPPALKSLAMFPNGSRIKGGWVLSASDKFDFHGRLERPSAESLLVSSGWGIGVISLAPDKTFYATLMTPYEIPPVTPPTTPPTTPPKPPVPTPPSPKTFEVWVEMKGTPVSKGPIPYTAIFPSPLFLCPGCRVKEIQTLSSGPKFIFFKAPGTSEECAKPDSKYIDVVSAGGSANLSFLYGSATPPTPLTIAACTDQPFDPSLPIPSVLVKVTYVKP
ncbi:MAG TPA: VCBS repeat-containing protein [Pyrinomonadaceae bacterium]|nr:VCBS repeat-containing protein [Pyrinomonadaceae bacterium]